MNTKNKICLLCLFTLFSFLCAACGKLDTPVLLNEQTVEATQLRFIWNVYDKNCAFLEEKAEVLSLTSRKIIARGCFNLFVIQKIEDGNITAVREESEKLEQYDRNFVVVDTAGGETLYFEMDNYYLETAHLIAIWINDYHDNDCLAFYAAE